MSDFPNNADLAYAIQTDDDRMRQLVRALGRRSLFFLTKAIVCYGIHPNRMDATEFKERSNWCQWVVTDHKRGLLEDPRGHMKTWGSTLSLPIWQAILPADPRYDDEREVARATAFLREHPHLKGPDARLVLASDSKNTAGKWVGSTMSQWETNPLLRWAYPERVWPNVNLAPKWSRIDGYILPGRLNPRDPNPFLRPAGTESKEQGGRGDGLMFDDLVGEQEWRSPTVLQQRRDFVRSGQLLLEDVNPKSPTGGWVLVIGNRWALDDVNSMIHDEMPYWSIWRRADRRCTIHLAGNCGRWASDEERRCTPSDEPLWKAVYPDLASLANVEAELGPEIYAAQRLNDPTSAAVLDERQFKTFTMDVAVVQDPVSGERTRAWSVLIGKPGEPTETIPLSLLSTHLISIDPAASLDPKAASTAISWFAMDRPTQRRFWLDCRAGRWSPDEAIARAYELVREVKRLTGNMPRILCEKVATQSYVASALINYAARQPGGLRIGQVEMIPIPRGQAKEDRQRERVGHLLGQGLLYLRAGLQLPRTEVRHWPTGTKDALDTLVQAEQVYLQFFGSTDSARLRARRRALRERRFEAATSAGTPL